MTTENKKSEGHPTLEKLEALGQMVTGEIEKIGGVLTADPVTQAEGDYNLDAGILHLESSDTPEEEEPESSK